METTVAATADASGVTPTVCAWSLLALARWSTTPPRMTPATSAIVVQMNALERTRVVISRPAIMRIAAPELTGW